MPKEPFNEFVRRHRDAVCEFPVRETVPTGESKYVMVIVEPREHPNFEFVCKTNLRMTDRNWGLHVFHGRKNEKFVKACLEKVPHVRYTNLCVDDLCIAGYNELMTSRWFYEQIDAHVRHFLVFQTDSCLLRAGALTPFVEKHNDAVYIGAPWPHHGGRVGNGGLSLRSRAFCLESVVRFGATRDRDTNEDLFFSACVDRLGLRAVDFTTACEFACELIPTSTMPIGVHCAIFNVRVPDLHDRFREHFSCETRKE